MNGDINVEVQNPDSPFGGVQVTIPPDFVVQVEVVFPDSPFGGVQVFGAADTQMAQIVFIEGGEGGAGPGAPGGGGGGGAVSSVFGRTGDVVALSPDYSAFYQPLDSDLTFLAGASPPAGEYYGTPAGSNVRGFYPLPSGGGGSGTGNVDVTGEVPSGALNGSNTNYTTASSFITGSLELFLNGLRQKLGLDYTVTGANTFQMSAAPLSGDILYCDYLIPGTAPTVPLYIGAKARFVDLSNGCRLEVQDSGGTWQIQSVWTE